MPLGNWSVEWSNLNSQRRYPLAIDAAGVDRTSTFELPLSFLVGLTLPVHAGLNVDASRFFLRRLGIFATGFSVVVGYQPVGSDAFNDAIDVASAMIPRDAFSPNRTYALGGIDDYADTVGKITVGSLDEIDAQPAGSFTFNFADARIDPDCVQPMLRYVSSITVVSGSESSIPLYGDIELVAEENTQLTVVSEVGQPPQIKISAVEGEGLRAACECDDDDDAVPIRRINGIPGTPTGDFWFFGNECQELAIIENGLRLDNICSEPCCGCEELEAVTRDLEAFGSKAATLENFLNRLEGSVTQFHSVVLGSRLSDVGCAV